MMNNKNPDQAMMDIMESYRQQQEYERCVICTKAFNKEDEVTDNKLILWSTDCFHMVHKKCFVKKAFMQIKQGGDQVTCPEQNCRKPIQEVELNMYLDDEQKGELEKLMLAKFLKDNPDLVKCNCGNMMEVVQGKVDMNQKDANGKPITREAAECMAKYRVRCF
jgi:hypothetical protein